MIDAKRVHGRQIRTAFRRNAAFAVSTLNMVDNTFPDQPMNIVEPASISIDDTFEPRLTTYKTATFDYRSRQKTEATV